MNKSGSPYKYNRILLIFIFLLPAQIYWYRNKTFFDYFFNYYIDNFDKIANTRLFLLSYINFSIGDIIYAIIIFLIIYQLWIKSIFYLTHKKVFLFEFLSFASIAFFFFQISWGLNYKKEGLSAKIKNNYDQIELEKTVNYLINKSNELNFKLTNNDSLKVNFPFNKKQAKLYFNNSGVYFCVKSSFFTELLSYMGFSGYINPFTLEAHVNENIPMLSYIVTIAHEQSHQKGIAAENEASYFAYKRTTTHKNDYIQYAGYVFALRHCLNTLLLSDSLKGKDFSNKINTGIKKNIAELNQFWKKYNNPFEFLFTYSYDKFLKLNGQKSGVSSYNEVVALIIFDINNQMNKLK